MPSQVVRLPSRRWSIVALAAAGMATVVVSYLLVMGVAVGFIALPYFLLMSGHLVIIGGVFIWQLLVLRLLLSAFGVVVGFTMLRSLLLDESSFEPNGIQIDLSKEPVLAREIGAVASALKEPMPSQVYLLGDANAFVSEPAQSGAGRRRILGLGLPLLQMLSIDEFRWVLAHEFAHYYSGDTTLGPWLHQARRSMEQVYQNLDRSSTVRKFVRRSPAARGPYRLLMAGLRVYWRLFMRIAQAIARRQEFRSDELACYLAGSQALDGALKTMRKCQAGLGAYWSLFVIPVVASGFQPELAREFGSFMQVSPIAQANAEYLAQQASLAKASPFDSHPPDEQRMERGKRYNLPAPDRDSPEDAPGAPAISLIVDLSVHETRLIRKLIPAAFADLKPLNWETAGFDIFVPFWRKQVAAFFPFLSTQTMSEFPMLVLDPRPLAMRIPASPREPPNEARRMGYARNILASALSLVLLDNGWQMAARPGEIYFEKGEFKVDPGEVVGAIGAGKLSVVAWSSVCSQLGIGNWPLAVPEPALPSEVTPNFAEPSAYSPEVAEPEPF